jgi:hypothetical protein
VEDGDEDVGALIDGALDTAAAVSVPSKTAEPAGDLPVAGFDLPPRSLPTELGV